LSRADALRVPALVAAPHDAPPALAAGRTLGPTNLQVNNPPHTIGELIIVIM